MRRQEFLEEWSSKTRREDQRERPLEGPYNRIWEPQVWLDIPSTNFKLPEERVSWLEDMLKRLCRYDSYWDQRRLTLVLQKTYPTPIFKWNPTYSEDIGLSEFLEQLEEKSVARGTKKEQVYAAISDILTGPTLIWYRTHRERIKNYDELIESLRWSFRSDDYELALWEEIRSRT